MGAQSQGRHLANTVERSAFGGDAWCQYRYVLNCCSGVSPQLQHAVVALLHTDRSALRLVHIGCGALRCSPFQGRFVIRRLGLAVNLYTKYEVSMFTHYEDMKGDEKCKNWGGLGD